jgi:hypothetical protein
MLADIVNLEIKKKMGKGNCISHSWSRYGSRFWAIVHRWPVRDEKSGNIENKVALLSIQPFLDDETDPDAGSGAEFLEGCNGSYAPPSISGLDLIVALTLDG